MKENQSTFTDKNDKAYEATTFNDPKLVDRLEDAGCSLAGLWKKRCRRL